MSLSQVLTIQEVCRFWGKSRNAVRYHLDRGTFTWRYTDAGRILVDRVSVERVWGSPGPAIDQSDVHAYE